MQKIVVAFVIFVSWWLMVGATPPGARADDYCSGNWSCVCSKPDPVTKVCDGMWVCECDEAGEDLTCECPPGYSCDRFGECHEMGSGDGGGGGGGIALQYCPSGTQPTGGVGYLPGTADMSCRSAANCDQYFPVRHGPNAECSKESQGSCEIAQLCCAPGQAVECGGIVSTDEALSTDVKWDGYSKCPGVGTRVAGTFSLDSSSVYCRRNCSCVTPCGTRPGTRVSCQDVSMGTYETQTFSDPKRCY